MTDKPSLVAVLKSWAEGKRRSDVGIASMSVTSDGFVIARLYGPNARQSESGVLLGTIENVRGMLGKHADKIKPYRLPR